MLDVVFDTVIFVRSLINPYGAWGRLVFDRCGYRLILSEPILREIVEVMARPELRRKYRSVPGRDPRTILATLSHARVVNFAAIRAVSRDPKDDKFLATAAAAKADYLVSEDQDLLVLKEYEGTHIITAPRLLYILDNLEARTESE